LLEVVPMAATVLLAALHWDQAAALAGRETERADLRLRPKVRPLSARAKAATIAAVALFGAVPYAEEFIRCVRTA
ncbi:MAG TPA: hypothetical protein VH372_20560, partial [Actinospica sp.]|nr:hypothetical protein [Actinospica sp.]